MAKGEVKVEGFQSPEFLAPGWSISNTVSPSAAGLANEGYGDLSVEASPDVDDEFLIDRSATVIFSKDDPDPDTNDQVPFGTVEGWVSGYSTYGLVEDTNSPSTRGPDSLTITPNLAVLNADRSAPAVVNVPLSEAFQTYVDIVTDTIPVNYTASSNPLVSFPGWTGNVWEYISNLAAIKGVELSYDGESIVVRDIQAEELEQEFFAEPSYRMEEGSTGQYVEVSYQDQTVVTSIHENLTNYSVNPSLEVSGSGWSAYTPSIHPAQAVIRDLRKIGSLYLAPAYDLAVGAGGILYSTDGYIWNYWSSLDGGLFGGFFSVAGNGSIYVAVGRTYIGTPGAVSSTNGTSWTSRTIGVITRAVEWGPEAGVFAAVGDGVAASSTNGTSWTTRTIPSGDYRSIAWGNGRFVAVGLGVAAYSSDGTSWTSSTIPSGDYYTVEYLEDRFLAIGQGIYAWSTDGVTWTSGSLPDATSIYQSCARIGDTFYAVGPGVHGAVSVDGSTWEPVPLPDTVLPGSGNIALWDGEKFIRLDYPPSYQVSYDFYNWDRIETWDYSDYRTVQRENNASRAGSGNWSYMVRANIPNGGVISTPTATVSARFYMPVVDVEPLQGTSATFGCWVGLFNQNSSYFPSTGSWRLYTVFYDSNGVPITTKKSSSASANGFLSYVDSVPSTAHTAKMILVASFQVMSGSGTNSRTDARLHVDCQFVVDATGASYFDGSTAGAVWNGTTGLSTSTMPNPDNIPLYDAFLDNNRIMEVAAGAVESYVLESNVWATSLIQPVPSTIAPVGVGNYHIIDSQGVPCTGAFVNLGGEISVSINDLGQIVATLKGPNTEASINGGPYRVASSDGNTTRGEFRLAGTGIITNTKTLRVPTGADPNRVSEEVAYSITYPFINDISEAYTVGFATGAYATAAYPVVQFSFRTDDMDRWDYAAGKWFKYNGSKFRIISATVSEGTVSITAQQRTLYSDVDEVYNGLTFGQVESIWGDLRYRDTIIKPLKES